MKRFGFVFLAALLALTLTACGGDDASIGIIGGADGPTNIYVQAE